jgi:putative ABC transport system substrate-binding protein
MRKRVIGLALSLLCTLLYALSSSVGAQQPKKIVRIGIAHAGSLATTQFLIDPFREGLRQLGYIEGGNVLIEYRFAEGKTDRFPEVAAELVRLKPDVIVVGGTRLTSVVKQTTKTIPIVVGSAGDLVGEGVIETLARPGGNVTGSTNISPELAGKRLELLKDLLSKSSRVAVLLTSDTGSLRELMETETAARALGVNIQSQQIRSPSDFESAYSAIMREHPNAVIIFQSSSTLFHRKQLVDLAAKHRLPSMCEGSAWTDDGCLISYGPDLPYQWRRAAIFVDKILKGTKPSDLPVEQPRKFELIINLKTAQQIGLIIPPHVLARADKVTK